MTPPVRMRFACLIVAWALPTLLALPRGVFAQDPPVTNQPDSLDAQEVPEDTAVFIRAPAVLDGPGAGFGMSRWVWDREALLDARAVTLDELLKEVPGLIQVRAGDFGMPRSVSWAGGGAGTVRVFRDGFELAPLRGGVEDLSYIGLSGVEEVRVDRFLTELHVRVKSLEPSDVRPLSLIETGQGDFNTNLFRGMLILPNALGGSVLFALDRIDTRGPRAEESGVVQGAFGRYGRHWGDRASVFVEFRKRTLDRDTLFQPGKLERSELSFRGSMRLAEGLVASAGYARLSLTPQAGSSGIEPDSTVARPELTQAVLRLGLHRGRVQGLFEGRWTDGPDAPAASGRLGGGFEDPRFGDIWVEAGYREAGADRIGGPGGESGLTTRVLARSRSYQGVAAFAGWESGEPTTAAAPFLLEPDSVGDGMDGSGTTPDSVTFPRVIPREGLRAGIEVDRWGVEVGAAWVKVESDSSVPLGLLEGESSFVLGPTSNTGIEVKGTIPLYVNNLRAGGTYIRWDSPEGLYMPRDNFVAGLSYHGIFRENRALELWADAGAEGRGSMLVPSLSADETGLETVPRLINWFGRVQLRIATVRIFINWENLAFRETNADLPGRFQPSARALWGVRWTLWN